MRYALSVLLLLFGLPAAAGDARFYERLAQFEEASQSFSDGRLAVAMQSVEGNSEADFLPPAFRQEMEKTVHKVFPQLSSGDSALARDVINQLIVRLLTNRNGASLYEDFEIHRDRITLDETDKGRKYALIPATTYSLFKDKPKPLYATINVLGLLEEDDWYFVTVLDYADFIISKEYQDMRGIRVLDLELFRERK